MIEMIEFLIKLFIFSIVLAVWLSGLIILCVIAGIAMLVDRKNPDTGAWSEELIRDWSRGFDLLMRLF